MRRLLLLLVSLAVGGCNSTPSPPPFHPVADVKQLMAMVIEPAAEVYWDAVGTVIDVSGRTQIEPQTTEEWDAVRNSAYVLTESGNLLMMRTGSNGGDEWMQLSRTMIDIGQKAIKAAEAHDTKAVFDVGAELYDACTFCHAKYAPETQRPSARQ